MKSHILIFSLLFLGACSSPPGTATPPDRSEQVVKNVFGAKADYDAVMGATSLHVCRLKIDPAAEPNLDGRRYREGERLPVSAEQAARLRKILADPGTYEFEMAKDCVPTYGVRILFATDSGEIALNLCFECNILTLSHAEKTLGGEDFDHARPALVALCQELFPQDAEIQNLPAQN
jgi:hypothetical protein